MPTPADLAAAMETVRKGDKDFTAVSPQEWYAATELLARWLAENAADLAMGDEHARARLAAALSPAFLAKGEQ